MMIARGGTVGVHTILRFTLIYCAVPLLCAWRTLTLGQDVNWDLRNYHLYNPYALLNGRLVSDLAPAGLQTWFNPLLDAAWLTIATNLPPKISGVLLGFCHGLSFILVYHIGVRVLPPSGGPAGRLSDVRVQAWLIALCGILSVGFQGQLGTTFHDNLVALFVLSALALILRARESARPRTGIPLLVAGLIAGGCTAIKLVAGMYALALACCFLFMSMPWRRRIAHGAIFTGGALAGFALLGGWWHAIVWSEFGNPVFPQFNDLFGGELAADARIRDRRFLPSGLMERLFYPFYFTADPRQVSERDFHQISWPLVYTSLILWAAVAVRRRFAAGVENSMQGGVRVLLVFFCASYVVWLFLFGIYRYLVTLELVLPLVLVLALVSLSRGRWRRSIVAGVLAVAVFTARGAAEWDHGPWADRYYRAELPDGAREPGAVLLMGLPLAWLVPALDRDTPFVQVDPNFRVNAEAWSRAVHTRIDGAGRLGLIHDPREVSTSATRDRLSEFGLTLFEDTCRDMPAWLGGRRFAYRYCEVGF